jgi:hypothetical protein
MKKKFSINRYFFRISLILLSIIVLTFSLPWLVNLNSHKSSLELELSSLLKTGVKIEGDISYSLKTGPKLNFENIIFDGDSSEELSGNINAMEISISPLAIFNKKVFFKKINMIEGSISFPMSFMQVLISKNQMQLKRINIENVSIKILDNESEVQLDNNSGSFVYNQDKLVGSTLKGLLADLDYDFSFKNNTINFSIPKIKFDVEYLIDEQAKQNSFLQIKSASNFLFPGFSNIYLRTNVSATKEKVNFNNIKLTSSTYSGIGNIEFNLQPHFFIKTKLIFGRTNLSSISTLDLANFFSNDLFEIASKFNSQFNIEFKNVLLDQNYFDDLNVDVRFDSGDIILNSVEFISKQNYLQLTGRIFEEDKDKLMFFNTKFRTSQLKKLCNRSCNSQALQDQYSMAAQGTLNIKKAKIAMDDFFSSKSYSRSEIENLNDNLNTMLSGNLEKSFVLKNFLSLY